ncbi:hypothetical protein [Pseudorhodobacter aquimaris]|uniref:hypothetical protein n=1 Tax=Pseudorhodobacter aquimaris TaxID=687412 RepID=UPI000B1A74E8|nr:hypothetical protein [Pseudorhodobacter aquimaris]
MKRSKFSMLAIGLTIVLAGAAGATTINEIDAGDFSGDYHAPTIVANGATTVNGIWSGGNDYDILAFTQLKSGAQTVSLSFMPVSTIADTDYSFAAGGNLNYKFSPFENSAWEGTTLATVGIQHWNRGSEFEYTIALDDDFMGQLYLGLFNTYGTLKYSIFASGNEVVAPPSVQSPVAAVPLPAAAALLLAGLGSLLLARKRRHA